MFAAAEATAGAGSARQPAGQEVLALTQSDFLLLVLLIAAVFYAVVAVIYKTALGPTKDQRLQAAAARAKHA
jgi:hypothetical protein